MRLIKGRDGIFTVALKNITVDGPTENDDAFLTDFAGFLKC